MKKSFLALFVAVLVLAAQTSVTACGVSGPSGEEGSETTETVSEK